MTYGPTFSASSHQQPNWRGTNWNLWTPPQSQCSSYDQQVSNGLRISREPNVSQMKCFQHTPKLIGFLIRSSWWTWSEGPVRYGPDVDNMTKKGLEKYFWVLPGPFCLWARSKPDSNFRLATAKKNWRRLFARLGLRPSADSGRHFWKQFVVEC